MTQPADKFAPALESAAWALEAVDELRDALAGFFRGDVAEMADVHDAETGVTERKLMFKNRLPSALRRKATDALVTARHCFDQAAYAAHVSLSPADPPKKLYFPWAENPRDLDGRLRQHFDERLWDIYRGLSPYPVGDGHDGGDSEIKALAEIANDKHSVGLRVEGAVARMKMPDVRAQNVAELAIPFPRWDPDKNEIVMARWKRGEGQINLEDKFDATFVVLLSDRRLTEPTEVVRALRSFAMKARDAVEALRDRCAELTG